MTGDAAVRGSKVAIICGPILRPNAAKRSLVETPVAQLHDDVTIRSGPLTRTGHGAWRRDRFARTLERFSMPRRLLPAACATFAATLALADLAPARAQATADQQPSAATPASGTPATPEAAAAPQPPAPEVDPLVAKVRELAAQPRSKAIAADRAALAPF